MKNLVTKIALILIAFCQFNFLTYGQDFIKKSDTDSIKCNVIKVGSSEIEYKKWENQNGPTYSINRSEVTVIHYKNGTIDIINQPKQKKPIDKETKVNTPLVANKEQNNIVTENLNLIQFGVGWIYPWMSVFKDLGLTNTSSIDPLMFSYERKVNNISFGGMLLYTRGSGDYSYFTSTYNSLTGQYELNLATTTIDESILSLGLVGNYYVYHNESYDISAGIVLGLAFVSASGQTDVLSTPIATSTTSFSYRLNGTVIHYFSNHIGAFARLGIQNLGGTILLDSGISFKF